MRRLLGSLLLIPTLLLASCAAGPEAETEPMAEPQQLIAVAHTRGETSALNLALQEADALLRESSGGRLGFDLYPDAALGDDAEMLSLVYAGLLPVALPRAGVWAEIEPDEEQWPQRRAEWRAAQIYALPWLYADAAQAVAAAEALQEATAPYLEQGVLRLGYFSAGSYAMVNSRGAVSGPADMAGLTFASDRSEQELPINRLLAADTRQYRHYEILDALARGRVTAAAAPLAEIVGQGWITPAPWLYLSGQEYEICAITVNRDWYQSLDPADRELLDQALALLTARMPALAAAEEQSLLAALTAAGAAVGRADAAAAEAFRAYMQPLYDDYAHEYPALYALATAAGE